MNTCREKPAKPAWLIAKRMTTLYDLLDEMNACPRELQVGTVSCADGASVSSTINTLLESGQMTFRNPQAVKNLLFHCI